MYRFSQQPQESTQLARLSLAKYSYTTTSANHSGPLNWSHLIGNGDIFVVFEKCSVASTEPGRIMLRVFRDYDILEEIDLAHFAQDAMHQSQSHLKPIFAVVVKLPCLAAKYPRDETSIRRFQIKFSLDRDFYTALAILSDIKCPFSESNTGSIQPARRLTSLNWNSGSISGTRNTFSSGQSAVIFPSHSSITNASGISSSVTAGSSLPPSSSGTVNTFATDLTATTTHSGQWHDLDKSTPHETLQLITGTQNASFSEKAAPRPSTATACHDIQTLNELLPPKRELPFSKPAAKSSCTAAQRSSTLSQVVNTKKSSNTGADHINNLATSSSQAPSKPTAKGKATQKSKIVILKRPSTLISRLNPREEPITNQVPAIDHPTQSISIPNVQQTELQSPPFTMNQNKTSTAEENSMYPRGASQAQQLDLLTSTDLSSYLSAPTLERTARLESWVCKHIEDDGFLQLCQDVEGVWRRIALGSLRAG